MSETPQPLPKVSLAVTCFGHAVVFGWAGATLPWRSGTTFAAAVSLLAVLHLVTGVLALVRKPTWLTWSWRALSLFSGLVFVILGWSMAAAAIYVGKLYLRMGPSVATGIIAAAVLLALLTVPMAIWGARYTWPSRTKTLRRLGAGASVLAALCVFSLPLASSAARADSVHPVDSQLSTDLTNVLEAHAQQPPRGARKSVAGSGPAACSEPLSTERVTLLVAYVSRRGSAYSVCLQGPNRHHITKQLKQLLSRKARPGSTVVVDLVRAFKPLSSSFPLLDALKVRPGIDGVCEGQRCLAAWQLTLSDAFSENRPIESIPDASYGFSSALVRQALGTPPEIAGSGIDGLIRIETESYSADPNGVHRLLRTRTTPPAVSASGVSGAVKAAQGYIIGAQAPDGTFRYALDPSTGAEDRATLNLPRQAGTTYALCELGQGRGLKGAVRRALAVFPTTETEFGPVSALSDGTGFGLGKSALPLLSMLRCRELAGRDNDRLIGQLSRLVLKLQRENGSFFPAFNGKKKRGEGEHEILYAAGQAVLSLVLLEQQLESLKGSAAEPLPAPGELKAAIDRAFAFYGGPYWPRPLRDFFFFEEGWHCLAARTALTSHRNDGYEQLCIDYVASRMRYVARADDTSEPNFLGGYGLSDMFPPRNTATAGLGEALNAAISIKQKRGLNVDADKAILRDLVGFLLRAQWSEAGCYSCKNPHAVIGGFSQQLASPSIRIDYVQHAMAAIGHGGRLLF
ncbi:MAG TPA: hypothetical protein VHP33_03735 [Polyangiaceae bacterium]|nr:hypothetical protein [Polyangiaceae bacterium]